MSLGLRATFFLVGKKITAKDRDIQTTDLLDFTNVA